MKINFLKLCFLYVLYLFVSNSIAAEMYELHIQNPKRQMGYVVGDVFTRTIELKVQTPYKLAVASIPTKGFNQTGIELTSVTSTEKQTSKSTDYYLQLEYQIFNSGATVKKLAIAQYPLIITYAGKSFKINVPPWEFRVSPLAVNGEVYIEQDMSPFRGPLLVDTTQTHYLLGAFLLLTMVATCGLIYINADLAWFPGMGGPFAMCYRKISNFKDEANDESEAILQEITSSIHHAFNQTFGENVFATDVDTYVQKHPTFAKIKHEISQFIQTSNQVLFAVNAHDKTHVSITNLIQFCAMCRHCERNIA